MPLRSRRATQRTTSSCERGFRFRSTRARSRRSRRRRRTRASTWRGKRPMQLLPAFSRSSRADLMRAAVSSSSWGSRGQEKARLLPSSRWVYPSHCASSYACKTRAALHRFLLARPSSSLPHAPHDPSLPVEQLFEGNDLVQWKHFSLPHPSRSNVVRAERSRCVRRGCGTHRREPRVLRRHARVWEVQGQVGHED